MDDNVSSPDLAQLMPHQVQLVSRIESLTDGRVAILAPAGSGITTALSTAIAGRISARPRGFTVLIITSRRDLMTQWHASLDAAGLNPLAVDQKALRSLEARSSASENPWVTGSPVTVTTIDVIKDDRVLAHLIDGRWDITIIDIPSHVSVRSQRLLAIERLLSANQGLAIVHSTQRQPLVALGFDDVSTWEIDPPRPSRRVEVVSFAPTPAETDVFNAVHNIDAPEPLRSLIVRRSESSIYSLELALRSARNRAVHGQEDGRSLDPEQLRAFGALLELINSLEDDSKGVAALDLARRLDGDDLQPTVIITDFADTARYLGYLFRDEAIEAPVLTGRASPVSRAKIREMLSERRGLLIQTTAAGSVDRAMSVIHYDVPRSQEGVRRRVDEAEVMNRANTVTHFVLATIGYSEPSVDRFLSVVAH